MVRSYAMGPTLAETLTTFWKGSQSVRTGSTHPASHHRPTSRKSTGKCNQGSVADLSTRFSSLSIFHQTRTAIDQSAFSASDRRSRAPLQAPTEGRTLERNVVVRNPRIEGRLFLWLLPRPAADPAARFEASIPAARTRLEHAAAIPSSAKQNHVVGNDFREVLLVAIFVLVATGGDAPLDINLLPF